MPACRYEKGPFSECQPNGEITRVDKLKASSDSVNCQQTRTITKKCNAKSKQDKQPKGNSKDKKQKGETENVDHNFILIMPMIFEIFRTKKSSINLPNDN